MSISSSPLFDGFKREIHEHTHSIDHGRHGEGRA